MLTSIPAAVGGSVGTITGVVSGLGADLLAVGAVGIGVSAGIFGLIKGWGVLRRLVK